MKALARSWMVLLLLGASAVPAAAFDWGGSVDLSTSTLGTSAPSAPGAFHQGLVARGWALWHLGLESRFLVKWNVTETAQVGYAATAAQKLVLVPHLESAVWSTPRWWVGRNDLRDPTGDLLSTKLDGALGRFDLGPIDLTLAAGTTALLFRSATPVVVSQADRADRAVDPDFTKPDTLFAPPRLLFLAEGSWDQIVPNVKLTLSEVFQFDLRTKGVAAADDPYDAQAASPKTAPVSMAYTTLGGSGRLGGPWSWDAAVHLGLGSTLTPAGSTWKGTLVANTLWSGGLTYLAPGWLHSIATLGAQVGSWDEDGATPETNQASDGKPTAYTGWFGAVRTGSGLVFSPQPANLLTTKFVWSTKPWASTRGWAESLQLVTTGLVFARLTEAPYSEGSLKLGTPERYLGSELDLMVAYRPQVDWGATLGFGLFLPNGQALLRGPELQAQLGLNLGF